MRVFEGAQEDGGEQANGKDPPRPTVIFSLHSTPESSRRTSDDLLSQREKRWAREAKNAGTFLQVPGGGMGSLKDLDTVRSWSRETRQFVSITAMHGVKRIWESRGRSKLFWGVAVIFMAGLMFWQVAMVLQNYFNEPFSSKVTLKMVDDGMVFPKITICNYNPIKQSYLNEINKTGDFPPRLVQYLLMANSDVFDSLSTNVTELEEDEAALKHYQRAHPSFTVDGFYADGGFNCSDMLKRCSFAGREFDCCSHARMVVTPHGQCQYMSLGASMDAVQWEGSENAGLQLILDARRNESIMAASAAAALANPLDAGFRFYVDEPETSTYSTSQGVSVSPGDVVYTAVSLVKYTAEEDAWWGNCTTAWPEGYKGNNTKMKYQSKDCHSKCRARHFNAVCTCSPFVYNIDVEYRSCSALEYYKCLQPRDGKEFEWPQCPECKSECSKWNYGTANSYGRGFSAAAVASLRVDNPGFNESEIRENFLSVSIFFRDLSFTEYEKVGSMSITQLLSNMGGTLGLFLGMSVLTVFESIIYSSKVLWTFVSCQRRAYTARKEREVKINRVETDRAVQGLRQLSARNLQELARSVKSNSGNSSSDSSCYSRENSWNNLAEKEPPPVFLSIPIPSYQ